MPGAAGEVGKRRGRRAGAQRRGAGEACARPSRPVGRGNLGGTVGASARRRVRWLTSLSLARGRESRVGRRDGGRAARDGMEGGRRPWARKRPVGVGLRNFGFGAGLGGRSAKTVDGLGWLMGQPGSRPCSQGGYALERSEPSSPRIYVFFSIIAGKRSTRWRVGIWGEALAREILTRKRLEEAQLGWLSCTSLPAGALGAAAPISVEARVCKKEEKKNTTHTQAGQRNAAPRPETPHAPAQGHVRPRAQVRSVRTRERRGRLPYKDVTRPSRWPSAAQEAARNGSALQRPGASR